MAAKVTCGSGFSRDGLVWMAATLGGVTSGAAAAAVLTFVQSNPGVNEVSLGYPVPLPVESQTAVAGFRSYAALQARLQDLAVTSDFMRAETLGATLNARPIQAYVLGDADAVTATGAAEAGMLQNGGIHAREWASPEVVAGVAERLVEKQDDGGLYRYLLENVTVVLVPVLNVDGFLQTQRYPDQALQTEFAGDPQNQNYPRDGRMQRKNMRDKDEVLCAAGDSGCPAADGMNGVDTNRNQPPYWASSPRSSRNAQSLVYHGGSPGSENESQALYTAAALGPAERLRLFIDTHSFSRIYFGAETGNARRDRITRDLHRVMNAAAGGRYGYDPTPPGLGIGATDEYFAYTYQIPSYTLEIEPPPEGSVAYGSDGYHHDGFILPENQIERVRRELADASVAGFYRMAGPPSVLAAEIREKSTGAVVFAGEWQRRSDATREFVATTRGVLLNDTDYLARIAFDKPMRVRNAVGQVAQFSGQNVPLAAQVEIEGIGGDGEGFRLPLSLDLSAWRADAGGAPDGYARYADDAIRFEFRVPASMPLAGAHRVNFAVTAPDFTGQGLDTNPGTAADLAGGGWADYEDSAGDSTDRGGTDRSLRIVDDGSPLFRRNGGSGALAPELLLLFLLACKLAAAALRVSLRF